MVVDDPVNRQAPSNEWRMAMMQLYFETWMEFDRSILSLSSGAIALIVTLLATTAVNSPLVLLLYAVALGCFLAAITFALAIFKHNGLYISAAAQDVAAPSDPILTTYDRWLPRAFRFGVIVALLAGVGTGWIKITAHRKDEQMNERKVITREQSGGEKKSADGITQFAPVPKPAQQGGTESTGPEPRPSPAPKTGTNDQPK
jgi:hypothetical protein